MAHRLHDFLVSLAILALVATTHAAGGHATDQAAAAAAAITQQAEAGTVGVVGSVMGSRPPNCEGKCGWWCVCVGRSCEAVLVPIEPPQGHDNKQNRRHGSGRGDHSNYKPMTWRCKCVGAS